MPATSIPRWRMVGLAVFFVRFQEVGDVTAEIAELPRSVTRHLDLRLFSFPTV